MAVPVSIFNTSSQEITVVINNGPAIRVPGTGDGQHWVPQTQAPGTGPGHSTNYPGPNTIGNLGTNTVQAFVQGTGASEGPFSFSLPNSYQVKSIQIYFSFMQGHRASFSVLTDGVVCALQSA